MPRDIKTKDTIKDVKVKDDKKNIKHFIRDKNISTKDSSKGENNKDDTKSNPNIKATNQVTDTAKVVTVESLRKTKKLISQKREQRKRNNINEKTSIEVSKNSFKTPIYTKIKINGKSDKIVVQSDYKTQMKSHFLFKQQKKAKEAINTTSKSGYTFRKITDAVKITYTFVKNTVTSVSNMISLGIGLLLLIVISLFTGVFGSLSDNSLYGVAVSPLSEEVLAYTDIISKYTEQYEIEEFTSLVQAIMMHESKGLGEDPMDSSLFIYNIEYPDGIKNAEYSINVGVHYLADCLEQADVNEPSDTKQIYLSIQAYDYGLEYIEWAVNNFGGYSKANAKVYLDMKKEETYNNFDGSASYVPNVWIYYRGSGSRIVEIAKAQIGNIGGRKYWEWYGFDSRVEWCACFVSWCANESGDLDKTIPRFSGVDQGMIWFKNHNKWKGCSYTPYAGDIIFFDWEQDGDPDHVGIVEKVENGDVYTVEGNSKDEVRAKHYSQNYKSIYGYGTIY